MAARETAERGEGIVDLDAINRGMSSPGFDDRGGCVELGGLREIVVAVDRCAAPCDEQNAGLELASVDAYAEHKSDAWMSRVAEPSARGLDHFGERERGLIAGNWRHHWE